MRQRFVACFVAMSFLLMPCACAQEEYSDTSRFVQGTQKVFLAPFQAPFDILQGLADPPFGIVRGALTGTYKTVTYLMSGLWDMAGAAAPYAKYVFPFFL